MIKQKMGDYITAQKDDMFKEGIAEFGKRIQRVEKLSIKRSLVRVRETEEAMYKEVVQLLFGSDQEISEAERNVQERIKAAITNAGAQAAQAMAAALAPAGKRRTCSTD